MSVTVHVPTSLRDFSGGKSSLSLDVADGSPLRELFMRLDASYPGIVQRVLDEQGAVRQHVNVFVNGNSIRLGQGLQTPVEASAEVWIIPAVSGG